MLWGTFKESGLHGCSYKTSNVRIRDFTKYEKNSPGRYAQLCFYILPMNYPIIMFVLNIKLKFYNNFWLIPTTIKIIKFRYFIYSKHILQ